MVLVVVVVVSSRIISYILVDIEKSFDYYSFNASSGQIALLEITADLNGVSKYSKDIMLGGEYEKNLERLKKLELNIKKKLDKLYTTLQKTKNEKLKLELYSNAKHFGLLYVEDIIDKMESLKGKTVNERVQMFTVCKKEVAILGIKSHEYFSKLSVIKNEGFRVLTDKFYSDIKKQKNIISMITIFVCFALLVILIFSLNYLRHYFISKDKLEDSNNLLHQYKTAMDMTSIVSKTDLKGKIIYVNEKFCEASQYAESELLGKPHNIVRSEETSPLEFKKMWKTIANKKVWKGIIKNKRKDDSYYYVDTTVIPILDSEKNIKEYIAIRKDITQMIQLNHKLQSSQEEILTRMGMIAETKSKETGHHVRRVAEYCKIIAAGLKLKEKDIELLYSASALHDIGKVGVPDDVLHKPGRLTNDEFEVMKNHAKHGYDMLKDSKNEIIKTGAIIALEHHEKYDGSGYPKALRGETIHIFARITALADVFDALGEPRSYKKAWELKEILDFIEDQKGKHFDPKIVEIFFKHIDEILFIRKRFKNI